MTNENGLFKEYRAAFKDCIKKCSPKAMEVLNRGIANCRDNPLNGVLAVGINPSFPPMSQSVGIDDDVVSFSVEEIRVDSSAKGVWSDFKCLFFPAFSGRVAYLDLFSIRCSKQNEKNGGESFGEIFKSGSELNVKVRILEITQKEIERLNPKIVLITNKQAFAYWGGIDKYVWMGYKLRLISTPNERIQVYVIEGRRNEVGMVNPQMETNLIGRKVVLYGLYRFLRKEYKEEDRAILKSLIDFSISGLS